MRIITNDEVLFTCELNLENSRKLSLCKQSYSDGTCFYTLQDERGDWKVEYGNHNISGLIEQIEHEMKVEEEYKPHDMIQKYPQIKHVYDEVERFNKEVINKLSKGENCITV